MIGLLRVIRGFAGFIFLLQVVGILPALNQMNNGAVLAMMLIKIIVGLIAGGIFFGLRPVINNIHEKKYGTPHPALSKSAWSL